MTPAEQVALSHKYITPVLAIVPTDEGLVVFTCRGAERQMVGTFATAWEFRRWLTNEYEAALRGNIAACRRVAKPALDFDPLANLKF